MGAVSTRRAARRSAARPWLATILAVTVCLVGIGRVAQGVAVPIKATVAQVMLEHAFDRSRAEHHVQRPWLSADMAPVARIRVPRLGVDSIVLDTGSGQAMAFGPTLLPGSAALGAPGTSVIAAHRDTHFRFLRDVRPGDLVEVERVEGGTLRYQVTGSEVVRWDRFAIASGRKTNALALSTCYPFGGPGRSPLRYVVHAEPVG